MLPGQASYALLGTPTGRNRTLSSGVKAYGISGLRSLLTPEAGGRGQAPHPETT